MLILGDYMDKLIKVLEKKYAIQEQEVLVK
mgnify:FL=1|jgi:hypothetical protein